MFIDEPTYDINKEVNFTSRRKSFGLLKESLQSIKEILTPVTNDKEGIWEENILRFKS